MNDTAANPSHIMSRTEWLSVVGVVFAFGGFFYTVNYRLGEIAGELHELNKTVAEGQVTTGKLVDHMISVDRRLDALEGRRP